MRGEEYEDKAVAYLKLKGYRIIRRNFHTRFGEIDIVASDRDTTVFVEVKARSKKFMVPPEEAVDRAKQRKLKLAAGAYYRNNPRGCFRFDVLAILYGRDFVIYRLIKNAFSFDNE